MNVLAYMLGSDLQASTPNPFDDHWYQPVAGALTAAGIRVDAAGAKKLSAWFRGRDLLATSVGMLPFPVHERLEDDMGSVIARHHPAYEILHDAPNESQDAMLWRGQKMFNLIDHGKSFDFIVDGGRSGFLGALEPIEDPTTVTVEKLDTGRVRFRVRNPKTGGETRHTQDEIFYLRTPSEQSVISDGVLTSARESLGHGIALDAYAASVFGKGTLSGHFVEVPGPMSDEARERMKKWLTTLPGEWAAPKILINGAKIAQNTLTPEHAQMILSKKHSVDDIARWLGVQRYLLDNSDPSFGNAEQMRQDFVDFSLVKWLRIFEFAVNRQLIIQRKKFYAEFNVDALVRGDLATRWEAHVKAYTSGLKTKNEIRTKENLNKVPGGDAFLDPAFLTGKQREVTRRPGSSERDDADRTRQRAGEIAHASAARLLRKEVTAVQKLAVKHASSEDDFIVALTDFYAKHAALVMETLQIDKASADDYCARQCKQALDGWVSACDLWMTDHFAAGLGALALEDGAA